MPSYKNIVTHTFKVCKCLKIIKLKMESPGIGKIYEYIHIFKEKSNFVADFMSIFGCFRRPGSVFLTRILNIASNRRIVAALVPNL